MMLASINWTVDPGAFMLPKLPYPLWGGNSLGKIDIFIVIAIIIASYFIYNKGGNKKTKEKKNNKFFTYCFYAMLAFVLLTRYLLFLSEREIRWYGLAFAFGFLLGLWIVSKVWKHEKLNPVWIDKLFVYVFLGTVIGARLGHCLFYSPVYYLSNPIELFKIWEGGLASHGGALGILIAVYIYSKKVTHKSMLWTLDRVVLPVGFVGAMIRLANLINSEVYGHPTTLPWGFNFYNSREWYFPPINGLPCHPTQIYEAICYIITGCLCMWLYWKKDAYKKQGLIFGVFFIGIFVSRFFIEFLKNNQEAFEAGWLLDMGQLLSIPFILAGIWFTYKGLKSSQHVLKGTSKN